MNKDAYIFSKYLLVLFSKYQNKIEGWKDLSNQFTAEVSDFNSRFNSFHKEVNETLNASELNYKGIEVADKEIKEANILKSKLNKYVDEFNKIGTWFILKYQDKIANKEAFESDKEQIKEFLSEYSAFEILESSNYWLESLECELDRKIQRCQKIKNQSQPNSN